MLIYDGIGRPTGQGCSDLCVVDWFSKTNRMAVDA